MILSTYNRLSHLRRFSSVATVFFVLLCGTATVTAQDSVTGYAIGMDAFANYTVRVIVRSETKDNQTAGQSLSLQIKSDFFTRKLDPTVVHNGLAAFDVTVGTRDDTIQVFRHDEEIFECRARDNLSSGWDSTFSILWIDPSCDHWTTTNHRAITTRPSSSGGFAYARVYQTHPAFIPQYWQQLASPELLLIRHEDLSELDDTCVNRLLDAVAAGQDLMIRYESDVELNGKIKDNIGKLADALPTVTNEKPIRLIKNSWYNRNQQVLREQSRQGRAQLNAIPYQFQTVEYGMGRIHLLRHDKQSQFPFQLEYDHACADQGVDRFVFNTTRPPFVVENLGNSGRQWVAFVYALFLVPLFALILRIKKRLALFCILAPLLGVVFALAVFLYGLATQASLPRNHLVSIKWLDCQNQRSSNFVVEKVTEYEDPNDKLEFDQYTLPITTREIPNYTVDYVGEERGPLYSNQFPERNYYGGGRQIYWARSGPSDDSIEVQTGGKDSIKQVTNRLSGKATFLAVTVDGTTWHTVKNLSVGDASDRLVDAKPKAVEREVIGVLYKPYQDAKPRGFSGVPDGMYLRNLQKELGFIRTGSDNRRKFVAIVDGGKSIFRGGVKSVKGQTVEVVYGTW